MIGTYASLGPISQHKVLDTFLYICYNPCVLSTLYANCIWAQKISIHDLLLQFIPTTLTLDPGKTNPPPLLSEADLLSRMDKVRMILNLTYWII